jgi:hypothetical protein
LIRFIDLGKQIAQDDNDPDWPREFSFYDTLQASFLSFDGRQVFDSRDDLIECLDEENHAYMKKILSVIPEWVPRSKQTMMR